MFLEGQVDRQTDRRVHRRPTPKQYPSDFIGAKPVLSTGCLVSCSRTQQSATGEARSRNPSISGQALYHDCAPQLGSILCRYDTCPTQYAPDLRGSILCMQGTQYAPRESILCMEHFVALHSLLLFTFYKNLVFIYVILPSFMKNMNTKTFLLSYRIRHVYEAMLWP